MRVWLLAIAAAVCWGQPERPLFARDASEGLGAEFRPLVETYCREFGSRRKMQTVTFGHFLGPKSADAVVSTSGCEPHSRLFGGSYVFAKREGKWVSLGYTAGMITEECRKLPTGSGLEFLLCTEGMGMQGSVLRVLKAYDFRARKRPRVLFSVGVWNEMRGLAPVETGTAEQGVIDSVGFDDLDGDGVGDVAIEARAGQIRLTELEVKRVADSGGRWAPPMRVPHYRVEDLVQWDRLVLTPRSAAAARVLAQP